MAEEAFQISSRKHRSARSEEHTSELQSPCNLVCRLLLEKKKTHEDLDQASSPGVIISHVLADTRRLNGDSPFAAIAVSERARADLMVGVRTIRHAVRDP